MNATKAILFGFLFGMLVSGTALRPACAQAAGGSVTPVALEMTEGAGNVVVLQEPPRAGRSDDFISINTVIIGCTAGAAAGALAIALPVLTVASSGIGLPASASAILGTAGIGCAVGVASGLAAIGTAWGLNMISSLGENRTP